MKSVNLKVHRGRGAFSPLSHSFPFRVRNLVTSDQSNWLLCADYYYQDYTLIIDTDNTRTFVPSSVPSRSHTSASFFILFFLQVSLN